MSASNFQPFRVICSDCGSKLQVKKERLVGRRIACPKCEHVFRILPPDQRKEDSRRKSKQSKPITPVTDVVEPLAEPVPPRPTIRQRKSVQKPNQYRSFVYGAIALCLVALVTGGGAYAYQAGWDEQLVFAEAVAESDSVTPEAGEAQSNPQILPASNTTTSPGSQQNGVIQPISLKNPGNVHAINDHEPRQFVKKFCVDCHTGDEPDGSFSVEKLLASGSLAKRPADWLPILERVESRDMPPEDSGVDRPTLEEFQSQAEILKHLLAEASGNLGRWTRRLNRDEYQNTLRDLLHLPDFELADSFPDDLGIDGFKTIVEAQSLSPALLEKYLDTAEEALSYAIVDESKPDKFKYSYFPLHRGHTSKPDTIPESPVHLKELYLKVRKRQEPPAGKVPPPHVRLAKVGYREGTPPKKPGDWSAIQEGEGPANLVYVSAPQDDASNRIGAEFENPLEYGRYRVRVHAHAVAVGKTGKELVREEVVDGVALAFMHEGQIRHEIPIGLDLKPQWYEWEFPTTFSKSKVAIGALSRAIRRKWNAKSRAPSLSISEIQVEGPIYDEWPPQSHRAIFGESNGWAAEEVIRNFATRAFRRPLIDSELEQFLSLYQEHLGSGLSEREALTFTLQAVLVSPNFLYLVEDSRPDKSLNDYEIASRLSYFLWSSMPDEELLAAASRGELTNKNSLLYQLKRMLNHPKSNALVNNFASQWLGYHRISDLTPDPKVYPEWDSALPHSMKQELKHFVAHVIQNNEPLSAFLDSDYTFVDQRLAVHYGIPGVEGQEFRRVSLKDHPQRGGLATTAGILAIGSNPTRSSPIKRGVFIVEKLFNRPPPNPPANVPALDEEAALKNPTSVREQLAAHSANPTCNACHKKIDYWGLPLESFDALGGMLDEKSLDLTAPLPDGRLIEGSSGVRKELLSRERDFAVGMTEKLLMYGIGRTLNFQDREQIESIVEQASSDEYRFHSLLAAIVTSQAFHTH
ncbi:DUF1592 domain-containing protein [Calycomorphotria hydatis]|uniref:Planctomycete cytochrome C n=1 Tax=Calycomorphotria hydatis TaxID=2528027 RepID=A0A517TE69_9PLAN|nr:DUF1592 domain-containing protein [Calycomorphotria hydatis]QDT66670.1 hypothetical protein V22_39410 [Calycomorphotria hydatis]